MIDRIDHALVGFDEAVLERWGLKPHAKETLTRAKERGAITPQEISEMVSGALAKDRQKMAEVLQEIKKILQNLHIIVTFNIVHTHTHIVQSPAVAPAAPAQKPEPQPKVEEQTVPLLAVAKGPQYAGEGHESPFLNAKILQEHGLKPEALGILLAAKDEGRISPQQIGALIPAEISQDSEKLRPAMRWITQLLSGIDIKIVIGEVHYKKPESRSPVTSYSRRSDEAPINKGKLPALFNSTGISETVSEEPSKEALLEMEQGGEVEIDGEESENADPDGEFIPKFIFDRESGVTNPYYRVAKNHKFLKHEHLLELSRRWHMHGDYEARNTIVVHNLRLSMKIAAHYMGRGLDYDDLVQEGNIGLMVAVERFDPEKGFHFTTYATWWVRQHMQRAIQNFRDLVRMPVHAQEALNKILKITCELGMQLQREPTLEEVAAKAEEDVDKVKKILHQLKVPVVSLEELAYCSSSRYLDTTTFGDKIMDQCFPSAVTALEAKEDLEIASRNIRTLLAAIKALPVSEKAKTAFKMYYGLEGHAEDYTLESIAETSSFGVTRERIRQMNSQIWNKLGEYGISMNDEKLVAALKRVHDLENIVCGEADLSTPTEALILDEVSIVFQDQADEGEMVPGVLIIPGRPAANLGEVELIKTPVANLEGTCVEKVIITPDDIVGIVSKVYGKTPETVLGETRPRDIVWVRWVCTYIMREELKSSFPGIAQALQYKEHTVAMHGYRSIKRLIDQNPALRDEIEKIIALCGLRQEKPVETEQLAEAVETVNMAASPIVDQVLTLTSQAFNIEKSSLFAKSVTRPNAEQKNRKFARDVTMHLLHNDIGLQRQEMARMFGFSDPGNVSVICGDIEKQAELNPALKEKIGLIRSQYTLEPYGSDLELLKKCQKRLFPKQVEELKSIVDKVVKPFKQKVQQLHAKLDALDVPDRHKEILRLRYAGDPTKETLTYEALGQTYDITRERVRQILMVTMERLTPTLDQSDIQLMTDYTQEFEKVRFLVELQNL